VKTSVQVAVALDTSVVIPYVMQSHPAHLATRRQLAGRQVVLTTHSLAESYSVLTRLPGDARSTPTDAATLLAANFPESIAPEADVARRLPDVLAPISIAGGAVYDALVGLAAAAADIAQVTRDVRAVPTYAAVGATIEIMT
jgi:predicted nucleic acid-binding protein